MIRRPTTLSGSPTLLAKVGSLTVAITAGVSISVDFMGKTGLNQVHVVASGANGFAAGTDVQLFLNSGTVNSVSAVGYVDREFSIENRGLLRPGGTLAAVTAAIAAGGTVGVASTVVAGTINVVNSLLAMAPDTINAGRIAGNALTATHIATAARSRGRGRSRN